jgi:hypothetical protein
VREFAHLELDSEDPTEDPAADDELQRQLTLAAAGEWEQLGLDPPGARREGFQPTSIQEFLNT